MYLNDKLENTYIAYIKNNFYKFKI